MDDFIPTRVSRIKEDAATKFLSVNYEKPKKQKAKSISEVDTQGKIDEDDVDERKKQEIEMKRLRYEIMKFGMSGLKGGKANKAKVKLAISLGAKPPKRSSVNYKEIVNQKRRCKEAQQNQKSGSRRQRRSNKHKSRKVHKNDSDGILKVYGKANKKLHGKHKK